MTLNAALRCAVAFSALTVLVASASAMPATASQVPATPVAANSLSAASSVGGVISRDTTWTVAESPVVVNQTVTIPPGVTLTVQAGVTVITALTNGSSPTFSVSGAFRAEGSSTAPVVFRSENYGYSGLSFFAGKANTSVDSATGTVDLQHVEASISRLVADSDYSSPPKPTGLATFHMSDSMLHSANGGSMNLQSIRDLLLERNGIVLSDGSYNGRLELGPGRTVTKISDNRFRGVDLTCVGGNVVVRRNTFEVFYERYSSLEQGSGVRVKSPDCTVDVQDNDWQTTGDLANRIYDGRDAVGLPLVDASNRSSLPTAATPALPPGVITYLTVAARNTGVHVNWTPGNDGGSEVDHTVSVYPVGSAVAAQVVHTTSTGTILRGLSQSQEYILTVTAANSRGVSNTLTSTSFTPVPEASVPGSPTLSVQLRPRGAYVTYLADSGGAPIAYYQWSIDGPVTPGSTSGGGGPEPSAEVTGLIPGESYTLSAYAHNDVGDGPVATTTFLAADVPSAPTGLVATPGDGTVRLSWTNAPANGSPVTAYEVVDQRNGAVLTKLAATSPANGPTTGTSISGLVNGTPTSIAVRGVNALGQGALSSVVTTSPVAPPTATPTTSPPSIAPPATAASTGTPGAVAGLRAKAGKGKATVTWRPAAVSGGPIKYYLVTTSTGASRKLKPSARSFSIGKLGRGTRVRFTVTAVSATGPGTSTRSKKVVVS